MQKDLYEQMKNEAGTANVINSKSGEVLVLLSTPSFDPNEFELGISSGNYKGWKENQKQPLLNRFPLAYSPGSTIKVITSTVTLNNGLDPKRIYDIPEKRWQLDSSWGNYKVTRLYDKDHLVDLSSTITNSDNIYFAKVGLEMGAEKFINGLKSFGIGEEFPFEYPMVSSQVSNDGSIKSDIQLADSSLVRKK